MAASRRARFDEARRAAAPAVGLDRALPNAKILLFDGTGITEVACEDTEHFAVTRDFLNHDPRRIEQLPRDDPEAP